MERVIAGLASLALAISAGQLPALHIHSYAGHDHPEHQHGPAAHEHPVPEAGTADTTVVLKSCDPSRHTLTLMFLCPAPARGHGIDAEFLSLVVSLAERTLKMAVDRTEIRVHGPPPFRPSAPRAPPSILPT